MGTKSEIIKELLPHQQSSKELSPSNIQVKIFDAPPTIQSLGIPSTVKTFQEYKFHFWSHIKKKTENMNRVDVVFDRYFDNSLKSCTRSKRGSSSVVAFQSNTPLPKNWHKFLCNSTNKNNLFQYLARPDGDVIHNHGQDVISTSLINSTILNKTCISEVTYFELEQYQSLENTMTMISPCDHEEADTRLLLHCLHASQLGFDNIMISTVDSDIVVLCTHFFDRLQLKELWIKFGVSKHIKYLAIHEISKSLGPEKCSGLLFFHAFSGCDTVSSFRLHGKRSAWSLWKKSTEMDSTFSALSKPLSKIEHQQKSLIILQRLGHRKFRSSKKTYGI